MLECQDNVESESPRSNSWGAQQRAPHLAKPFSIEAAEILDDVRVALEKDLARAKAGVDRLAMLLTSQFTSQSGHPATKGKLAPWQTRKVLTYIHDQLDEPILIESLAQIATISVGHFSRAFKNSTGETPHACVTRIRIERARELMLQTKEPLSQIAIACGFADQSHFSRQFRSVLGQTPGVWRRMNAQDARKLDLPPERNRRPG